MSPGETIALLGTGTMGAAMGRNLLGAGFAVRAWNRTAAKARPLAEAGASVAASPAEAASGAGILLTMLADGQAVEATVAGPSGALEVLGDGALWVQSSTVGADDTERLAELAREHGVGFVDAPVLGTKQPAEKGELTVLASGPEEARALGVDPERFLATIEGGPMGPAYARIKGDLMVAGDYPTSFSVLLAAKDVRLALEAAAQGGADLLVPRTIADLYRDAIDRGLGGADMAAIYEATRPRS